MSKPFIIFTMQRTGGTNLTNYLIGQSGCRKVEHEPFLRKRQFGPIRNRWDEIAKVSHGFMWLHKRRLRSSIKKELKTPSAIKHCVENVPWEVTKALVTVSAELGYRHIFLIRQDSATRLLSMVYAKRSGVWGPGHADKAERDKHVFDTPLNLPEILGHEEQARRHLNQAWQLSRKKRAEPKVITFEDVYSNPHQHALDAVSELTKYLEIDMEKKELSNEVDKLRSRGNQGTRSKYSHFIGIDELSARLDELDPILPLTEGSYS